MFDNVSGAGNTAVGGLSLVNNVSGFNNTVVGIGAGGNILAGNFNVYVGTDVGAGLPDESNTIRIGRFVGPVSTDSFIAGAFGLNDAASIPLRIAPNGHLATGVSSARFKKDIKPMDKASETILALKPVTFHYKNDAKETPQFGLVAEDVAKVNPDLVVLDRDSKPYSVRYEMVNAMLLNEFLKEHRKVEEQSGKVEEQAREMQEQKSTVGQLKNTVAEEQVIIAQQQKGIEALTAQLKEQATQIQKMSAQLATASPSRGGLEVTKAAPQTVSNK